jgi:hypothetical protein
MHDQHWLAVATLCILATSQSWSLATVPVIWSAIGGSAAFLLGVHADVALPIAGLALAIFSAQRTTPEQRSVAHVIACRESNGR